MSSDSEFQVMADLCIEAGTAVMEAGSEELRAAMRVALVVLADEIVARDCAGSDSAPFTATRLGRTEGRS